MESVTQTPDVPSGSCFQARVTIYLLYQTPTTTRIVVLSQVEYLKSTWIKMAIDHAVPEGIKEYHIELMKQLDLFLKDSSLNRSYVVTNSIAPVPEQSVDPIPLSQSLVPKPSQAPAQEKIKTDFLLLVVGVLVVINLIGLYFIVSLHTKLNQVLGQVPLSSHTEL
jgi:hypothetical protein